ncbi:MAG: ABC transporter permease [Eubacteriales bacterium]|nr:ABC transporter permease [Eubacteriales bacterium]
MAELLNNLIPNVIDKWPDLWIAFGETLYMMVVSGLISFLLGMIFGVVLTVTAEGRIMANKPVFTVLDKVINIFRSVPFIILLAALIPLTRLIVGKAIGTAGAIIPLIFGTVPFFSRQIESALAEVDHGLIEAAQSMGVSPIKIIFRVYLRESIPGIVRGTTITVISLVGLTAMAGAVGGGGLGDFAIRYGYNRNQVDITYATVVILVAVVSLIQGFGNIIIRKTTH